MGAQLQTSKSMAAIGGYFLLHYFALTDNFPLRSGMPCAARTFL